MRFPAPLLGLFALSSCGGQADPKIQAARHAEQRLAIVEVSGSEADRCVAARQVEEAWLDALDQQRYLQARKAADLLCSEADLQMRLRTGT